MKFWKRHELWRVCDQWEDRPILSSIHIEPLNDERAAKVRNYWGEVGPDRVGLAVGCNGFVLAAVPVWLAADDVPGLIPHRAWKDSKADKGGWASLDLGAEALAGTYIESYRRSHDLGRFPNWRRALKLDKQRAGGFRFKQIWLNPRLMLAAAKACGLRDDEGFGLDCGRTPNSAVYLSTLMPGSEWDLVPPFAVLMPMARKYMAREKAA